MSGAPWIVNTAKALIEPGQKLKCIYDAYNDAWKPNNFEENWSKTEPELRQILVRLQRCEYEVNVAT